MLMAPCRAVLLQVSHWGYCPGRDVGVLYNAMERFVVATVEEKLLEGKREEQQAEPMARERNSELKALMCLGLESQRGTNL